MDTGLIIDPGGLYQSAIRSPVNLVAIIIKLAMNISPSAKTWQIKKNNNNNNDEKKKINQIILKSILCVK